MTVSTRALSLHVTGVVQGVGFRPFVFKLATGLGLTGWVLNASDGVHCVVEGPDSALDEFVSALEHRAPAMAVVEHVIAEEVEAEGFSEFSIRHSQAENGAMTLVSPDIATCPECLAELFDVADRRAGYPFINCTNCGPRFTIIDDIPYDRPMTTMRDFPMCAACGAEYADPSDRRFHAQPDACFVCGPRLYLNAGNVAEEWHWSPACDVVPRPHRDRDTEAARSEAILDKAAALLLGGAIVAIKGLGGFHLACLATDEDAVARLRERKRRWGKPLAIMVHDLATAAHLCHIDETERALLEGPIRPVMLLRRRGATPDVAGNAGPELASGVAGGLAEIGVMLAYTPLHHLLIARVGAPLVMTSGNLSDEPIATENTEALERLSAVADAFVLHDREIHSRYDDSVVRVVGPVVEPVRRARGYAPHPLRLPFSSDVDILAAGPEQKNTFTVIKGDYAFVSQHIGDMENAETMASFEETLALYRRLFRIEPAIVAHDLHPEYLSTKWALGLDLAKVGVQHHHAHIASVTAEHGISDPVIGIALDGTGYGTDGRIWGGEVLLADWSSFIRFAHLRYVPMPGGSAAIRRPARMATGTLAALGLLEHPGARPLRERLAPAEEQTLLKMIERNVNCPLTSSMGRLFDTVAAICGVADDARYEGEAAILLEACADPYDSAAYEFALVKPDTMDGRPGAGVSRESRDADASRESRGLLDVAASRTPIEPVLIDMEPVLRAVLDDVDAGVPAGVISARFHRAVSNCVVTCARAASEQTSITRVALGGGVFMNRLVLGRAMSALAAAGFEPLTHISLPVNDAAVSHGQAVVAWARRHEV